MTSNEPRAMFQDRSFYLDLRVAEVRNQTKFGIEALKGVSHSIVRMEPNCSNNPYFFGAQSLLPTLSRSRTSFLLMSSTS